MVLDPWIEKAWRLYRETECFPDATVLKAVRWLEEKHRKAPHWDTAVVIALHYLILAMREEMEREGALAEHYLARAHSWKAEATGHLQRVPGVEIKLM